MSGKLFLVPEDILNNWQQEMRNKQVNDPEQSALNKIDEKMQDILNDSQMDKHDKEKLYTHNLATYLNMKDKQSGIQNVLPQQNKKWSDETLSTFPKTLQTKAKAMMNYLQSDKDVEWDDKNQLIINGKVIPHSNIIDLLHDSVRARKTSKKPKGWKELSRHFKSRNIAKELIGNSEWKDIEEVEEEDHWMTPPGSPRKVHRQHPQRRIQSRWIHLE